MATTDLSSGSGRRKQAKPQRKNVYEELGGGGCGGGEEPVVTDVGVGAAWPPPGVEHLQLSMTLLTSDPDSVPLGPGGGGAVKEEESRGSEAALNCIHCAAPFPSREQLDKHELLHSPNAQVSCKVCNKTFANVYRLQRHMISHEESAVLRKFKCPECDKAFKFKHHLKEHIRIHSGEKPFECSNCGKRFSHSGSYSSHMTSKKCLVMNLKVSGGGGGPRQGSPRGAPPDLKPAYRSQHQVKQSRPSYPPLLAKYGGGGEQPSVGYPGTHPSFSTYPTGLTGQLPPAAAAAAASPYLQSNLSSYFLDQLRAEGIKREEFLDEKRGGDLHSVFQQNNNGANGDLEAVKRILETVNASVTKQFLGGRASSNSCSSGPPSPRSEDILACRFCGKGFGSGIELHQHERYLCSSDERSEGLAAKLEGVVSVKSEEERGTNAGGSTCSEDEGVRGSGSFAVFTDEEADTDHEGRKVRVRSQIAEEQLQILRSHYALNPRPKRDELARIADRVGFPVRVVQVWFQNSRARDRREGRLLSVGYPSSGGGGLGSGGPMVASSLYPEQPLDLSTKPRATPPPLQPQQQQPSAAGLPLPLSPSARGVEEAVNLTRGESRLAQLLGSYYASATSPTPGIAIHPIKRPWKQEMSEEGGEAGEGGGETADEASEEGGSSSDTTATTGPSSKRSRHSSLTDGLLQLSSDGQFSCDQCDKTFAKHSSLARHKYEHSGQRPHKCDVCSRAFKHKHHLTEHKRLHSGEKPFQCSKCLKRFSHSGSYSQHMSHRFSYCKPYREALAAEASSPLTPTSQ